MREESLLSPTAEDEIEITLRPHRLDEFIGQDRVKERLWISIEAARAEGRSLDHILLSGPPGLGKTTLAGIVAAEMGTTLRVTSGPALERPGDLAAISPTWSQATCSSSTRSTGCPGWWRSLYSAMEDFVIDIVLGKGPPPSRSPLASRGSPSSAPRPARAR